jgi:hypothetical protein
MTEPLEHPMTHQPTITIRPAVSADAVTLAELAQLDSAPMPAMPALVAEIDGTVRAALSMRDGSLVADPFTPTAEAAALLRASATARRNGVPKRKRFGLRGTILPRTSDRTAHALAAQR